ncbi:hypothetical protein ACFL4Z_03615, partial [candidate division KSB1 bacterium]
SKELLPPQSIITFKEIPAISEIYEDLKIIQQEAKIVLANINNVVQEIHLKDLTTVIQNLSKNIEYYSDDINKTIKNMSYASSKLADLIDNINSKFDVNSEHFADAGKNLSNVLDKSIALVENMTKTLNTINKTMYISGKNVDETLNNLSDVSRNLKEFSNRLRSQPWSILRKSYEEEKKKK